jgi:hypothetical protein
MQKKYNRQIYRKVLRQYWQVTRTSLALCMSLQVPAKVFILLHPEAQLIRRKNTHLSINYNLLTYIKNHQHSKKLNLLNSTRWTNAKMQIFYPTPQTHPNVEVIWAYRYSITGTRLTSLTHESPSLLCWFLQFPLCRATNAKRLRIGLI